MENASKALIIAGAILLAILLITIGIVLINSGRDVAETGTTQMSSQALQAFNSQFIPYEGTNKSSNEVISLIDAVVASNATHSNVVIITFRTFATYQYHKAPVTGNIGWVYYERSNQRKTESEIKSLVNDNSNKKYKVTLEYCKETDCKYSPNRNLNWIAGAVGIIHIEYN